MRETYDFMNFSYDTMKSAKLRGLHGLVGRVGPVGAWVRGCVGAWVRGWRWSKFAWVAWVAGVYKFLLWVNEFFAGFKFLCGSEFLRGFEIFVCV